MRTTIEIDDSLLKEAKRLAVDRGRTLRSLVEEGLRRVVEGERPRTTRIELPVYAGPPVPDDFPWHSGKAMLDYLEAPDAPA